MRYSKESLSDKTSPNPFAGQQHREAMKLSKGTKGDSSKNSFPNSYKITSFELYANDSVKNTNRRTRNVLDTLSAVGGLFASLKGALTIFVSIFAPAMMNA